jgi:hypothetical protein
MSYISRLLVACAVIYGAWVLWYANIWMVGEEYIVYRLLDALNLGIHEVGHFLFLPVRSMAPNARWAIALYFLGGSLTQWAVPLIISLALALKRRIFDAGVLFLWFAQSLHSSVLYIGDAKEMDLPLWGADGVLHDWNQIFSMYGMLDRAGEFAEAVLLTSRIAAGVSVGVVWGSFFVGLFLLVRSWLRIKQVDQ